MIIGLFDVYYEMDGMNIMQRDTKNSNENELKFQVFYDAYRFRI